MSQNWIKDIRQKVAQHKKPAPSFSDEEWDAIYAFLPQKKPTVFPVWACIAVAASIVAVAAGIGLRLLHPSEPDKIAFETAPIEIVPVEVITMETAPEETVIPEKVQRVAQAVVKEQLVIDEPTDTITPYTVAPPPPEDPRPACDSIKKEVPDARDIFPDMRETEEKRHRIARLTAQAFLTGTVGAHATLSPKLFPAKVIGEKPPYIKGSENLEKAGGTKIEVNHRLPIRVGITIYYGLDNGWGLESGLTVSHHSSDFKTTGESFSSTKTQELLFIGVPINLNYRFTKWNQLSLYASIGGIAEKMVAGSISTSDTGDKERISIHPLQFSANTSLGIDYLISKGYSLYAEPGLRYSFNNGSGMNTIYADRPLDCSLTVGVRLHLHEN